LHSCYTAIILCAKFFEEVFEDEEKACQLGLQSIHDPFTWSAIFEFDNEGVEK
jgi:hypothetical protein